MILNFIVFFPFVGALLSWIAGRKDEKTRAYATDLIVGLEFLCTLILLCSAAMMASETGNPEIGYSSYIAGICGFGLHFTTDGFRVLYVTIGGLMWMMTGILCREYFLHHKNLARFYVFFLLTEGATMGVFLAADLYTMFIFFEIMSFISYVWVAQEENAPSLRAAETYLSVAVIGGLVMLMGIFLLYDRLGTLTISELHAAAAGVEDRTVLYIAGGCLFFGFGAKAGAFPLHIWLPKAHPVAPAPASALLSGILTKTGIFGILAASCNIFLHDAAWGRAVLLIGVLTMFGGAMLAVFSIDLKRTLACSSMSQIGFILVGVGMQCLLGEENALAVRGTFLHMVNHSLIKLVLFMAAGAIYMKTHALDLNKIRGYGRKKPLLKVIFLIGALAIGGIPMFSGYISKTLLHESIVEYYHLTHSGIIKLAECIFLFSGGLTVAYMTKLFIAIFVEKNEDIEQQSRFDTMKSYMNIESTFALLGSAVILLIWGLFPGRLMNRAAAFAQSFMHLEEAGEAVHYFSLTNLKGGLISIAIGALVYVFFIRKVLMSKNEEGTYVYVNRWPAWLDLENLIYRPLLLNILPTLCELPYQALLLLKPIVTKAVPVIVHVICRTLDSGIDWAVVGLRKSVYKDSPLPQELAEGTAFTKALGTIMNFFRDLLNATVRRSNPISRNYVHTLAIRHEEFRENNIIIARTISFGLFLAGVGFCLTMFYLLWW
ncbi:MAG: complex I subunit 5 family protein [Eubacteriales bacterium]|nr:complex I subunit 5 family protein [Eubacteriales bacterium]